MITQAFWATLGMVLLTLVGAEAAGANALKTLFIIHQGGKAGYMDRTGKIVIPPRFDGATGFREGLASVKVGEKWGVIDQQGKTIVSPQFEKVRYYSEGLARVKTKEMYGFIDHRGKSSFQRSLNGPIPLPKVWPLWRSKAGAVLLIRKAP